MLEDQGDFWLSEDTTKPNKGWDAVLPRICSWGKFRVKETGFEFFFFNVHFDHVGKTARKESARLIMEKMKAFDDAVPAILTGDFNVDQNSDSYKVLNGSKKLTDAYEKAALHYGAKGTYNGFKPDSRSDSRIDHIFITDDFRVAKHGVLTDSYKTGEKELEAWPIPGITRKRYHFTLRRPGCLPITIPFWSCCIIRQIKQVMDGDIRICGPLISDRFCT